MKNVVQSQPMKYVEVYLGNDLVGILPIDRENWVDRKLRNWLIEQAVRKYINDNNLLIRSRKKFNELKRLLKPMIKIVVVE